MIIISQVLIVIYLLQNRLPVIQLMCLGNSGILSLIWVGVCLFIFCSSFYLGFHMLSIKKGFIWIIFYGNFEGD